VHSKLFNNSELLSIHGAEWPDVKDIPSSRKIEEEGEVVIQAVSELRKAKSKSGMPLSSKIQMAVISSPEEYHEILRRHMEVINRILHIEVLRFEASNEFSASLC